MLDENITWEEHMYTEETKLAKNIALIYLTKPLVKEKSHQSICFRYIYSFIYELCQYFIGHYILSLLYYIILTN